MIRANEQVRIQAVFSSTASLSGVVVEYFIDNINSFVEARNTVAMTDLGGGVFSAPLARPGESQRGAFPHQARIAAKVLENVSPRADDPAIVPVGATVREGWHAYFVTPTRTSTRPIYDCFVASADLTQLSTNITQSPRRVTQETTSGLPRAVPHVAGHRSAMEWNQAGDLCAERHRARRADSAPRQPLQPKPRSKLFQASLSGLSTISGCRLRLYYGQRRSVCRWARLVYRGRAFRFRTCAMSTGISTTMRRPATARARRIQRRSSRSLSRKNSASESGVDQGADG